MKKTHVEAQTAATENIVAKNMSNLLDLPVEAHWEIAPPIIDKRPAGRPKGTPNKLSAKTILDAIEERQDGLSFAEGLADDYVAARNGPDRHLAMKYQQLILNKVLADKVDIEVIDHARVIEAKAAAFQAALEHIANQQAKDDNK